MEHHPQFGLRGRPLAHGGDAAIGLPAQVALPASDGRVLAAQPVEQGWNPDRGARQPGAQLVARAARDDYADVAADCLAWLLATFRAPSPATQIEFLPPVVLRNDGAI